MRLVREEGTAGEQGQEGECPAGWGSPHQAPVPPHGAPRGLAEPPPNPQGEAAESERLKTKTRLLFYCVRCWGTARSRGSCQRGYETQRGPEPGPACCSSPPPGQPTLYKTLFTEKTGKKDEVEPPSPFGREQSGRAPPGQPPAPPRTNSEPHRSCSLFQKSGNLHKKLPSYKGAAGGVRARPPEGVGGVPPGALPPEDSRNARSPQRSRGVHGESWWLLLSGIVGGWNMNRGEGSAVLRRKPK